MIDTDVPAGFVVEEVTDIRCIDGLSCLRLTRATDGASVLIHEIDGTAMESLGGAEFQRGMPDFRQPFVTRIVSVASYRGRVCLVEPLPLCVSLVEVWQTTLREHPRECRAVLRAIISQVRRAAELVRGEGRVHGAICAENVVLTDAGVYGLLQAQISLGTETVWVRPMAPAVGTIRGSDEASINRMVHELVALAMSLDLPMEVRQGLLSLVA